MKTLEERAKQWATDYPKTPDATYTNNDIGAIAENSFIQGATEQKDIDIKALSKVYADLLSAKGYDIGTINSELARLQKEIKED